MAFLADSLKRVKPSATIAVTDKARVLKAAGRDVIGLGVGEPDFDTPDNIKEAAIKVVREGRASKYTAVDGIPELKAAIIRKFKRENGLDYKPSQIIVGTGGKQVLYNALMATLNPGDEVIIPAPYWVSYPDMVLLAGGTPVEVMTTMANGYKMQPEALEKAITPKTKWIIFNSPSNPTGAAYTRAELRALGEVLMKHPKIVICTDDMYEHIYWADEPFVSFAKVCPELYERVVTTNGVAKSYAMTGWRLGYCGGPVEIVTAMATIQGQSTSNPSSISQKAAVTALNADQSCVREMNKHFKQRHDFIVAGLNKLPGVSCLKGAGTFYAFANVEKAIHIVGTKDDNAFAEHLLTHGGVAVVPGSGFGAPGHMRLSFACSMQTLEEALRRMEKTLRAAQAA